MPRLINSLTLNRSKFFQEVAELVPGFSGQFVIVTHILNDRLELLDAISQIGQIVLVVAIPYSVDLATLAKVSQSYSIITPSLAKLRNSDFLIHLLYRYIDQNANLIILEIGGYFAGSIKRLREEFGSRFIGVIESTEAGHRQYEKHLASLCCPVISVCRGSLKRTEYSVVGNSCIFSTEHLIRKAGFLLQGKDVLVIGFGKVGQGLARGLARYNCKISVYDTNPILRVLAYSEGFKIPDREEAIKNTEIIFGATGNFALAANDIPLLKKGCILVSTSSKDIEFDMHNIKVNYQKISTPIKHITHYQKNEHFFYVLADGMPVNFIDGAVMGPVLALVQAEIIYAIKIIIETEHSPGIIEIAESDRKMLATKWLHYFNQDELNYLYETK